MEVKDILFILLIINSISVFFGSRREHRLLGKCVKDRDALLKLNNHLMESNKVLVEQNRRLLSRVDMFPKIVEMAHSARDTSEVPEEAKVKYSSGESTVSVKKIPHGEL